MAEETRQLILEIEFSTEKQIAEAARLRQAIDADKVALAALNAEGKKNGGLTAEQAVQVTKLEQSIKKNTQARNGEVKSMENYSKAITNAIDKDGKYNGSINNLRGSLAFLTDKWNNLTKAERDNAAIGGVLQKEIKQTSDTLKNLEGSVGDNRRSVGGYAQAILSSIPGLGGMAKGIEGVGLAMKASPLGIFTTALQVLPQLLNSSGEGADFLAKVMQQINAVFQVGLKYIVKFGGYAVDAGKSMSSAFSNPKKILTDLVDFIQTNLLNRLKAFSVIIDAIKTGNIRKAADGFIQLGTGVTDATEKVERFANKAGDGLKQFGKDVSDAASAGGILADRMDQLENAESRFEAASSKTRLEIQKLIAQSKNRTLSEKERMALLDKADKMEVELNKKAIKLAQDRMDLIKAENQQNQGDEDEEIKRVNEQQKVIDELRGQSLVLQEKLQTRKDALLDAAAAREKARADKLAADQKKADEESAKRKEDYIKTLKETGEKEYQDALKNLENYLTEQNTLLKKGQAQELESANGNKESIKEINERYAKAFQVIEEKRLEAEKVIQTDYNKDTVQQEAKLADLRLKSAQDEQNKLTEINAKGAEDRKKLKEAEYTTALAFSSAFAALGSLAGNLSEEMSGFAKATALFQLGVSTSIALAKAMEGAVSAGTSVAEVSGPAAPITGPSTTLAYYATMAGTIFSAISQAKQILEVEPPKNTAKFADGTVLNGPSHTNGGIQMYSPNGYHYGEAEGGETLLTAGVQRNPALAAIASLLNQAAGGKPLGPTRYAAAGGFLTDKLPTATRNFTNNLGGIEIDYKKLGSEMRKLNIVVRPSEITNFENKRGFAKSKATLSR